MRHYIPYMIAGELICITGTAILTQLHPNTRTVAWAAYLVVAAVAVLLYQLGGAVAISMGQTVILTTIVQKLQGQIPGLSSEQVLTSVSLHVNKA
ncbi:hypothetical protein VTN00DRAFT_5417 [Thermoascus crustaceus]|uniref:uncharacterized protein n=1 Tax=Thermoascus crustaceus TaxID=5088 RepID=UPI00374221DB